MALNPGIQSVYVHLPFCETKCHYCDFYSLATDRVKQSEKTRFEKALPLEFELRRPLLSETIETIFMGGGTPSMTPPEAMEEALQPLWKNSRLSFDYEWTMEANPSSIDRAKMELYRSLGINRVSVGVQSLHDDVLKKFGRAHNSSEAHRALDAVFEAGFTNVSADLLCGLPGGDQEALRESVEGLLKFPLTHISIYLLTLSKTHRMFHELPNEDQQLSELLWIDEALTAHGFEHYEISNFSKGGARAKHNLRTWKGETYLGFGPSAHSFALNARGEGTRFKNFSSLHRYCEELEKGCSPAEWEERLTPEQRELEKWMLTLRLSDGFPKSWIESRTQKTNLDRSMKDDLIEEHPNDSSKWKLTSKGFALSDSVILALSKNQRDS